MPDTLNKQSIINLLIDSPLREPIKINLIDIVNNTSEPDLPKVYTTITKELEIFQKATERRMKLAEETIAKLGGTPQPQHIESDSSREMTPGVQKPGSPLDLPPLPQPSATPTTPAPSPVTPPPLSVPPLDLPPMPSMPTTPVIPTAVEESPIVPTSPVASTQAPAFQPLGAAPMASSSDEDALAEIQKELDSLKSEAASDITKAAAPAAAPQA